MKKKELIKKISLLKTIHPNKSELEHLKKNIHQQVRSQGKAIITINLKKFFTYILTLVKENTLISAGITLTLLLILFLSVYTEALPTQIHKIILSARLTNSPNQYERARLALADTMNISGKNNVQKQYTADEVSQSITLTNNEMSHLKLKGEIGKYTTQQCQELYKEYLSYLEKEIKIIPPKGQQPFSPVRSQIRTYEEQAEKKLHMYKNL